MLVLLRDRGISLPAGAILISPWVDLTHSFPSLAGDDSLDYIPAHGFLARPSLSWPPPSAVHSEDTPKRSLRTTAKENEPERMDENVHVETTQESAIETPQGQCLKLSHSVGSVLDVNRSQGEATQSTNPKPGPGHQLSIIVEGETIVIKDQIQMYTTNELISHPLVSPVLQPSLGGLPPLLILTGGGELLRDEQIYLAHKAANPSKYPPGELYLHRHPEAIETITKWRPTNVQLQVWDDLCHVAPTLSFTRPAKYMYRSIAQFGAWCLARAQKTDIQIQDDDISIMSSGSDTESSQSSLNQNHNFSGTPSGQGSVPSQVGKAGSELPPFKHHMIRQRVDRHGNIYPLEPASSLPALQVPTNEIGTIKPEPVMRWKKAYEKWDLMFAKEKRKFQSRQAKDEGFGKFDDDERPPPSALAGRRRHNMPSELKRKKQRSWGMSLWSLWGSAYDEAMVGIATSANSEQGTNSFYRLDEKRKPLENRQPSEKVARQR